MKDEFFQGSRCAFAALLLALASQVRAEEPDLIRIFQEMCQTQICRSAPVRMRLDNGSMREVKLNTPMPYVLQDALTFYTGDELLVEVQARDGRLEDFRVVEEMRAPARTLSFRLVQEADMQGTFMWVRNPFDKPVKYNASYINADMVDFFKTSTCPAQPGNVAAVEHWPEPVFQIVLENFRFIESSDVLKCVY